MMKRRQCLLGLDLPLETALRFTLSPLGPQAASLLELPHWSLGDDGIHGAYWDRSGTQSKFTNGPRKAAVSPFPSCWG